MTEKISIALALPDPLLFHILQVWHFSQNAIYQHKCHLIEITCFHLVHMFSQFSIFSCIEQHCTNTSAFWKFH